MARRFAFAYVLKDRPDRIREVVPYHADYWRDSGVEHYIGGPFADRSGGLISFAAASLAEAQALVTQDPLAVHALLADSWLKEWMAQPRPDAGGAVAPSVCRREDEMQGP